MSLCAKCVQKAIIHSIYRIFTSGMRFADKKNQLNGRQCSAAWLRQTKHMLTPYYIGENKMENAIVSA